MTNKESFTLAYLEWKRGLRKTEPRAGDYGLDYLTAETIALKCHADLEKKRLNGIMKMLAAA